MLAPIPLDRVPHPDFERGAKRLGINEDRRQSRFLMLSAHGLAISIIAGFA
jgi:hypothetical protein